MMKTTYRHRNSQRGTILLLALWSLTLLMIFAVSLGVNTRQKVTLLLRLEEREKLHLLSRSGVKKAIAILKANQRTALGTISGVVNKANLFGNPDQFGSITLNGGSCEVSYAIFDDNMRTKAARYGMMDEEGRINVNTTDLPTLKRLIKDVLRLQELEAGKLASAMIDWRQYGESEITGFYSDQYYENLEYPYPPKKSNYEVLDELLLVKGMNQDIFREFSPYLTIYGSGGVNVNTAPRVVLLALGLQEELVDKILSVRRGPDGIEGSADDYVFQFAYDLVPNLQNFLKVTVEEIETIDDFNRRGKLATNSYFYLIQSRAKLSGKSAESTTTCVFNLNENKIVYWKEKFGSSL